MLIFLIFICIALVFKDVCFAFNDTFNGDLSMSCPSMKIRAAALNAPAAATKNTKRECLCVIPESSDQHNDTHSREREIYIYIRVCLKIVFPYIQWLMIIIPTKWLSGIIWVNYNNSLT